MLELAKVEVKFDDDPEKIMARIKANTNKAYSALSETEKQYMQAEAFRRCLHGCEGLCFCSLCYITTRSLDWIFFLNLHKLIEVTRCLLADVSIA